MARSKRIRKKIRNKLFPFLKLPAELRFIVYRELLKIPPTDEGEEGYLAPDPLALDRMYNSDTKEEEFHAELGILRTSKIVHKEAAEVLYGENAFWFTDQPYEYFRNEDDEDESKVFPCNLLQVSRFFKMIGLHNVSSIRKICFDLHTANFILPPRNSTCKNFSLELADGFHQLSLHNNLTRLEIDLKEPASFAFREMVEDDSVNPQLREAFFRLRVKKLLLRADRESELWVYEAMESIQVKPPVKSLHRIWY